MELLDLTTYAEQRYGIREQRKWESWPGFSVLVDPRTGKWAALLMRQWDGERGEEIQRCDVKCGRDALPQPRPEYLVEPFRMKGFKWVGVVFGDDTQSDVVLRLFDCALGMRRRDEGSDAPLIELPPEKMQGDGPVYADTPLDFRKRGQGAGGRSRTQGSYRREAERAVGAHAGDSAVRVGPSSGAPLGQEGPGGQLLLFNEEVPERIRAMLELYEYGDGSPALRVRNFCRQGAFMADYEDDEPWKGSFRRFFPTYHDLNVPQLRGYFTWRTHARKGDWRAVPTSFAYIYVYELLSGIGTSSPEDALAKMRDFEDGFVKSGVGDAGIEKNLRRWMLEYAVLNGLPPETARACADPALIERDAQLAALKLPDEHGDDEVFAALCAMGGKKLAQSPVSTRAGGEGKALFAGFWRYLSRNYDEGGRGIFTACFGERRIYKWFPLANAVCPKGPFRDVDYVLDECREYRCRDGSWQELRYVDLYFDLELFRGLLHEADRLFRRALKTGRYLRERAGEAWATPYVEAFLVVEKRARAEAARPKVEIDFSDLGRIRQDAAVTRDSLLVEDGGASSDGGSEGPGPELASSSCSFAQLGGEALACSCSLFEIEEDGSCASGRAPRPRTGLPRPELTELDALHARILSLLVQGQPVHGIIAEAHLMPSVVADAINEALFDEVGDNVVECDGSSLVLVDDYRGDVMGIIGGNAR